MQQFEERLVLSNYYKNNDDLFKDCRPNETIKLTDEDINDIVLTQNEINSIKLIKDKLSNEYDEINSGFYYMSYMV